MNKVGEQAVSAPEVTVVDSGLKIDFSSYFHRELEDYCFFPMKRKRNFVSIVDKSAAALKQLLGNDEFVKKLTHLRYCMSVPEGDDVFIPESQFAKRLAGLFGENEIAIIDKIVTDEYERREVDINTEHSSKNNEELQFTNEHAVLILKWSYACVAAAPIITTYMDEHDIQARDSTNLIMDCFCNLLRCFESETAETDILAKIRKLVESRVLQTRYSDKVIWNYLRNLGTDPALYTDSLFRRFILEGIPKVEQGTNIILFFQAFLKNQLKYQFTARFPFSFKSIRQDTSDPEGNSASDYLEGELIRRDEASAVLGEIICREAVQNLAKELRWFPSKEEIDHWCNMLKSSRDCGNDWQRSMVTKFFLPRIRRVEHIRTRTLREYVIMLLLTRRWLLVNEFPSICDYMGARVSDNSDSRKLLTRKKFIREFMDSSQYRELLGQCFINTSQSIIDSNVVIEMISAVHVGSFQSLPEYGDAEPYRPRVVDHRIETIAQEILRFIAHISS